MHATYWERNKAVKQIANDCKVKTVRIQKWLYNPISGVWMFLKADKDRFSTLNQSAGVYIFDTWLMNVRKQLKPHNIKVLMQYHDELMLTYPKHKSIEVRKILKESINKTNKLLKLNIDIDISIEEGNNYSECH